MPAPEVPAKDAGARQSSRPRPAAPPLTPVGRPAAPGADGGASVAAPPKAGGSARRPAFPPVDSAPRPDWGWGFAVAGLAVAFAPEALLYVVALGTGAASSASSKATAGSALALAVGSLVIYVWQTGAAWLFSLRTAGNRLALWGFRKPNGAFFWTIPLALVAVYAVSVAHDIVVHPRPQNIVTEFPHTAAGLVLFVIVAVIMAPLFEETFFRGFLFRGFATSWGWVWGAVASAAVFGLAHLQLSVFVPLFALGFALAWVYKRTGSLWTSIALHALFNAISVLAWALTR